MLGALATVTLHGEYGHALLPLAVAALTVGVGWITWCERSQARPSVFGEPDPEPMG